MNSAEYDTFAGVCYPNIAIASGYRECFHEYKIRVARGIENKCRVSADNILDLGSRIGYSIRQRGLAISESRFPGRGNNLAIFSRLDRRRVLCPCVSPHLPWRKCPLSELCRVTRRDGMMAVFERMPMNAPTIRAVNTRLCDANARLICLSKRLEDHRKTGWQRPELRYHVFLPVLFHPCSRWSRI